MVELWTRLRHLGVAGALLSCASGGPAENGARPEPGTGVGRDGEALGLGEPSTARPPRPGEPRPSELVVMLGGDVNLGRHVGQRLLARPGHQPFAGVLDLFRSADVVLVNLESPLSDQDGQTQHPSEHNVFTGPPRGADALAAAGVQGVSVANNHAWDYGLDGFVQTIDNLRRAGVVHAGGSDRRGRQFEPAVIRVRGWSVAVIAATDPWNPGRFESHEGSGHVAWAGSDRLVPAIERARREHDIVLVSVHAGREYAVVPDAVDVARFRRWAEAGADAVVGHHPHVLQGISWQRSRPLFHSLGNLVFGIHRDHPWTARSVLARLTLSERGAPRVALCPIVIIHDEPHPIDAVGLGGRAAQYREHVAALSEPLGGVRLGETAADGCFEVAPPYVDDAVTDRDRSAALLGRPR